MYKLAQYRATVLLRSRFASKFLYMANGTGFGPVRAVQEYVKFDVASAAFDSFSIWHIEFLYIHLKDSVVSICACHPCAGAMLIFSVSFQFYRMIPEGHPRSL